MNIIIRDEQAEDIEAIEELTKAAFKMLSTQVIPNILLLIV